MEAPLEITVEEAARLLKSPGDAVLLDVREPDEWTLVHVEGSRHLPMRQVPEHLADLPRDRPIMVICHHGNRSGQVMQFLRAHGYSLASNVAGGIDAWAEAVDPRLPRY